MNTALSYLPMRKLVTTIFSDRSLSSGVGGGLLACLHSPNLRWNFINCLWKTWSHTDLVILTKSRCPGFWYFAICKQMKYSYHIQIANALYAIHGNITKQSFQFHHGYLNNNCRPWLDSWRILTIEYIKCLKWQILIRKSSGLHSQMRHFHLLLFTLSL